MKNLKLKITSVIIAISLFILASVFFIFYSIYPATIKEMNIDTGVAITKHLSHISSDFILNKKDTVLNHLVNEHIENNSNFIYIHIFSKENNIIKNKVVQGNSYKLSESNLLVNSKTSSIKTSKINGQTIFEISEPIIVNNQAVGTVRIGVSNKVYEEQMLKGLKFLIPVSIIILILCSLLGFWFASLVAIPSNKLIDSEAKLLLRNTELQNKNEEIEAQSEELTAQNNHINNSIIQLNERNEEIKSINDELNKINKQKDKFFSIIAHDLKNPFGSMMGMSELLIRRYDFFDDEKRKKFIHLQDDSLKSTYKLLQNLLEWARSQQNKIEFKPQKHNLTVLYDDIIDVLEPAANRKNIEIVKEFSPKTVVFADENMLKTILRNLISNAIKFSYQNSQIFIRVVIYEALVEITVADKGTGIRDDDKEKLFSLDKNISNPGTEDETGTGLGLLLCKEFVEKHNGKIWVESTEGNGSTFFVTLPN